MVQEGLHFTVGRICEETGALLGVTFSRQVVATIADIAATQLDTYTKDLIAFARWEYQSINADERRYIHENYFYNNVGQQCIVVACVI